MRTVRCDDAGLAETASALNAGAVAVIPTDTVYGLAAHPGFPSAVERLYTIKGRAGAKPIALLASDADAVARFGFPLSGEAARLASAYQSGRNERPTSAASRDDICDPESVIATSIHPPAMASAMTSSSLNSDAPRSEKSE